MKLYLHHDNGVRAIEEGYAEGYASKHSYIHLPHRTEGFLLRAYIVGEEKSVLFKRGIASPAAS